MFEEHRVRGAFTEIVFGILVVEDLIAILLLTLATALSRSGRSWPDRWWPSRARRSALRGRTGATIVAIVRGEQVVLVPDGHETRRAGDVVAVAGTQSAIAAARALLVDGDTREPASLADPGDRR